MCGITRCYQFVKDKNFESNSQLLWQNLNFTMSCYQFVKDKNFESNSQLPSITILLLKVVISLSKIKISKAIHNKMHKGEVDASVVISLSKIKISKAIHNIKAKTKSNNRVVISLSKIKISKAIHNLNHLNNYCYALLSVCQR